MNGEVRNTPQGFSGQRILYDGRNRAFFLAGNRWQNDADGTTVGALLIRKYTESGDFEASSLPFPEKFKRLDLYATDTLVMDIDGDYLYAAFPFEYKIYRLTPGGELETFIAEASPSFGEPKSQPDLSGTEGAAEANVRNWQLTWTPITTQIFSALNDLLPLYRFYWPEKASEVVAFTQQFRQEVPHEEIKTQELFPTESSRNDVESILERAEAERSPENRDALYFQAALSLAGSHDYERAAKVADRARDRELKDAVLQHILRSRAEYLISKGKLDEAFKAVGKISDPAERADVAVLLVAAARKKGDLVRAREALDETVKMLGDKPDSEASARSRNRRRGARRSKPDRAPPTARGFRASAAPGAIWRAWRRTCLSVGACCPRM